MRVTNRKPRPMKTPSLPLLLLCGLAAPLHLPASSMLPLYEETFNTAHPRLRLANGASLGGPGTGVSGRLEDRAYVGIPRSTEQEPDGPAAFAISPVAPDTLSAFTCTFWYLLEEHAPDLQVPLETAGFGFLLHQGRGFEVRISSALPGEKNQQFFPGSEGPLDEWNASGRWIFAAFVWDRTGNTLTVFQGSPHAALAFMREMRRPTPAGATLPRANLDREPETIGNTYSRQNRPLAGRIDNLRIYDRVLNRDELEAIRQADTQNSGAPLK